MNSYSALTSPSEGRINMSARGSRNFSGSSILYNIFIDGILMQWAMQRAHMSLLVGLISRFPARDTMMDSNHDCNFYNTIDMVEYLLSQCWCILPPTLAQYYKGQKWEGLTYTWSCDLFWYYSQATLLCNIPHFKVLLCCYYYSRS